MPNRARKVEMVAPVSVPGCDIVAPAPARFHAFGIKTLQGRVSGNETGPLHVVLGGISASRFVADHDGGEGWWGDVVGPDRAVDLNHCQICAIEFEPQNAQTEIVLTTADHAELVAAFLDHLNIETIDAFIGASFGGMVALAFAQLYPQRLQRLAVLAAAHRPAPMSTALRSIQQNIIRFALENGKGEEGVALARQIAMTTYRTDEEFDLRFSPSAPEGDLREGHAVASYLQAQGKSLAARMSPLRYLNLSAAIDRHFVQPERIKTSTLVVSFSNDRSVPNALTHELAMRMAGAVSCHQIQSLYGHDGFLKEPQAVSNLLRKFLETVR